MSLQANEKLIGDHSQDDLQNLNHTLDEQSSAHIGASNAILVPIRLVTEKASQHFTQDPSNLSTNITTITQLQSNKQHPGTIILLHHQNMIHLILPPSQNNQVPLITISMVL